MRRWVGTPRLGLGCLAKRRHAPQRVGVPAGARRAEAGNASAWVRTKRDQSLRPRVQRKKRSTSAAGPLPDDRSDQTPMRLAGVRWLKDQRQTPTAGLDRGRRDSSTPPIRPALLAESYVKSAAAAFPLGRPFQRANHPSGHTRATGIVPPRFLWSETLVKPNNAVIVAAPAAAKEGFRHPLPRLPPKC